MFIITMIRLIVFILFFPAIIFALENLDEMESRESRRGTNTFYHGASAGNDYIRQPQSLIYVDSTTSHEVTVLSSTDNHPNVYHGEVPPATPWSADGTYLGFFSKSAPTGYSPQTGQSFFSGSMVGYIATSDGSQIRELMGAAQRAWTGGFRFYNWNPSTRGLYYSFGENGSGLSLNEEDLYQNTVTANSIAYSKLGTIANPGRIYKTMNPAGTHLVAQNSANKNTFYPVQLKPTFSILDDGWSYDRGAGTDYGNSGGCGGYTTWHDLYFPDPTGSWFVYMSGASPCGDFYKHDLTGSDGDGGPTWGSATAAWDTQESEVMWIRNSTYPQHQIDAGKDNDGTYWAHPDFDNWGTIIATGMADNTYYTGGSSSGTDVTWNYKTRQYVYDDGNSGAVAAHTRGRQYVGWQGFTDFVSIGVWNNDPDNDLFIYDYDSRDTDGNVYVVARHYGDQNSSLEGYVYVNTPRQGQSPDGTKLSYPITFLVNVADKGDIAYAVAYYPHPPEVKAVTATGGTVTVEAWWNLGTTPRGYSARGWPDESTDDALPPREIDTFRLWRCTGTCTATSGTWTPVKTFSHDIWDKYDFSDGTWDSGNEASNTWTTTESIADGTYYYAITSIETSGLESRCLGNIYSITVSSGSGTGSQSVAYPSSPGDLDNIAASDFYTSYNTGNTALKRYYNIYAEDGSSPAVTQANRVASIPNGDTSWVDWLGNTGGTTQYSVTIVDTQGNESAALSGVTVTHQLAPATATGQYTIDWSAATVGSGTATISTGTNATISTGSNATFN